MTISGSSGSGNTQRSEPGTRNPEPGTQHAALSTRRWLGRARRRLWLRRAIPPIAVSLGLAALAGIALPAGVGPTPGLGILPAHYAVAAVILAGGLIAAGLVRPSIGATARAVDRDLQLRERLTTAAELLERDEWRATRGERSASGGLRADPPPTSVAALQLAETAKLLSRVSPSLAVPLDRAVQPIAIGLAGVIALAGLALAVSVGGAPGATAQLARAELPTAGESADEGNEAGPPAPLDEAPSRSVDDVTAQLAESRRQQDALDRLAEALGTTAAARDAADALRAGDTERAATRLAELARENDQLSPQAREQLTQALRAAADDPASAPLAASERAAAAGLQTKDYRRGEQGLSELARAVRQSGQQQTPHEDLARAFQESSEGLQPGRPESRPEAQSGQLGPRSGQAPQAGQSAQGQSGQGQPGAQPGTGAGQNADAAGPGDGRSGGGPGAGSGSSEYRPEEGNTRLGVAGVPVELDPGQPDGSGRPADPNAPPPIRIQPGSVSSGNSGAAGSASTDPVEVADTNRHFPVDTRGAVRDYFTPPAERPAGNEERR